MNQKGFANIVLIILVVVLAGALGYVTLVKKYTPTSNEQLINPVRDEQQNQPTTKPATKTDIELAREALIDYFNFLNKKQYSEAIKYHGSGYEFLQAWNPRIDINDHISLLKNGCEINGLQCLKIKNILSQQQISSTEFKFLVQFENNDGTLFKRGPCCGATEEQMPTKTDFEYTVKKVNNDFLIMTPPVYVP